MGRNNQPMIRTQMTLAPALLQPMVHPSARNQSPYDNCTHHSPTKTSGNGHRPGTQPHWLARLPRARLQTHQSARLERRIEPSRSHNWIYERTRLSSPAGDTPQQGKKHSNGQPANRRNHAYAQKDAASENAKPTHETLTAAANHTFPAMPQAPTSFVRSSYPHRGQPHARDAAAATRSQIRICRLDAHEPGLVPSRARPSGAFHCPYSCRTRDRMPNPFRRISEITKLCTQIRRVYKA